MAVFYDGFSRTDQRFFYARKIRFMISVHNAQDMQYTPTLLSQIDNSYSSIPLKSNLQD